MVKNFNKNKIMEEQNNQAAWFKSEDEILENSDADMENDNSTDSPTVDESQKTNDHQDESPQSEEDKKQTEENSSDEDDDKVDKDEDFAKHPAWQKREEKWKERFNEQEERHSNEIADVRKEIGDIKKDETPVEVPNWFGGDEEQWKEFRNWNDARIEKVKEEAKNEVLASSQEKQKKIDEATTYMNEQIAEIESEAGEKIDKNKLLKITLDNEIIDTKGRWNYKLAYKLMKAGSSAKINEKKKSLDEKKELAAATTSEKKSETDKPSFMTNEDFEDPSKKPW